MISLTSKLFSILHTLIYNTLLYHSFVFNHFPVTIHHPCRKTPPALGFFFIYRRTVDFFIPGVTQPERFLSYTAVLPVPFTTSFFSETICLAVVENSTRLS